MFIGKTVMFSSPTFLLTRKFLVIKTGSSITQFCYLFRRVNDEMNLCGLDFDYGVCCFLSYEVDRKKHDRCMNRLIYPIY